MKKILALILLIFAVMSCANNDNSNQDIKKPDQNIDLNAKTDKKTFVGFVATWCPHCKNEMPIYEQFYKENKGKVNMQIIVVDGKEFPGGYSIPQDLTNPITYEDATKEKCDYIPSYVIYDENKNIIEKKCGAKLTIDDLKSKLLNNEQLSSSGNTLETNKNNMDTNYQTKNFSDGDVGVIMTTSNGKIEIKLFPNEAPKTVMNFLGLAQKGYYNNLIFHRIIKNFMIQGGDPTGTGMGGESIFGKEFEDEFSSKLHNIRGSISMANAGANTNGSQFFINQKDNNYLDNKHSVFGQIINGLDNVDKIASVKTDSNDKPEKDVKIIKVEIVKFEGGKLVPFTYSIEENMKKIEKEKKDKQEVDKNRVVKAGDKISVNYVGRTALDNKEFDSSYKRGKPIEFEVGAKMMIAGFDIGVVGMKIGEKKTLNIKAKDAYGEYDPKNIQEVKKADLKQFEDAGYKLEAGIKLPTMYGEFAIKEVNDDIVKIDLNHALAGKDLIFDIELMGFNN